MPTTPEDPMTSPRDMTWTELEAAMEAAHAAHDDATDPRGDAACPECPEGTLEHTNRPNPAATQVVCDVCGFSA